MSDHDQLLEDGEPVLWTCPRCQIQFLTLITDLDRLDGCQDGVTLCFLCLNDTISRGSTS